VRDRWKARIRIVGVVKKAEDADLFALASLVVPQPGFTIGGRGSQGAEVLLGAGDVV